MKIGKVRVGVDPVIGQPWGSLWEIKGKALERINAPLDEQDEENQAQEGKDLKRFD